MTYFISSKRQSCLTMLMTISCILPILIQLLSNMFSIRNLLWCVSGFILTKWSSTWKKKNWSSRQNPMSSYPEGVAVPLVDAVDLLRITLNDSLNFRKHNTKISKKVGKQLDVLCRLKNIKSFRTKLFLYNSFTMSHFHYCSSIWHLGLKFDSKKLDRLLERALRYLYSDESSQTSTLFYRTGYSLVDRRIQNLFIIVLKTINNYPPEYLRDLFRLRDRQYQKNEGG